MSNITVFFYFQRKQKNRKLLPAVSVQYFCLSVYILFCGD
nr:MAG TPA: hypothetical protein [Caudoviricetes sp.]